MRRVGFRLLVVVLISTLVMPLLFPASAQDGDDVRVYISDDFTISFEYPAEWQVIELPLNVRVVNFFDPATQTNIDLRMDVVYPGTRGLRQGEYAGLTTTQIIQEFIRVLDDFYVFDPIIVEQLFNKEVAYTFTDGGRIMLLSMDLGRNNIGIVVAYVTTGTIDAYLFDVLEITQSIQFVGPEVQPSARGSGDVRIVPAGPDVVPFILDPATGEIIDPASIPAPTEDDTATEATPDAEGTPTEGTVTETPTATATGTPTLTPTPTTIPTGTPEPTDEPEPTVAPTDTPEPTITPTPTNEPFGFGGPDDPDATEEPAEPDTDAAETSANPPNTADVPVAFFAEDTTGTLTLLYADGAMTILNQSGAPLDLSGLEFVAPDAQFFIASDFSYITRRALLPGSCLYIASASQTGTAPSYCNAETSQTRIYAFADAAQRAFVWRSGVHQNETFGVLHNGELVARCFVDDGACSFEMPVAFGGFFAQFGEE